MGKHVNKLTENNPAAKVDYYLVYYDLKILHLWHLFRVVWKHTYMYRKAQIWINLTLAILAMIQPLLREINEGIDLNKALNNIC